MLPSSKQKSVTTETTSLDLAAILETIILFYLAVCLIWFSLYTLVPFINYTLKTPFRNFRQVLRFVGAVLSVAEIILSRGRKKAPGCIFLYGICATAIVSSFLQRQYGFARNLDSILWMGIIFTLFYSAVYHFSKRRIRIFAGVTFTVILVIWAVASCLSLVQFALQISAEGPNYAESIWLSGRGFLQPRLFGLFGYPEYGAVTGLMLIAIGGYFIATVPNIVLRAVILLLDIPIYLYILISGSRNAAVAMYEIVFVGVFLFFFKYRRKEAQKNPAFSLLLALLAVASVFVLNTVTMRAASHIPDTVSGQQTSLLSSPELLSLKEPAAGAGQAENAAVSSLLLENRHTEPVKALRRSFSRAPVSASAETGRIAEDIMESRTIPAESLKRGIPGSSPVLSREKEDEEKKKDILKRTYNNGDISTGRSKIWKDYLSLWRQIGLFGLSPENAGFFIQNYNDQLYICQFIIKTDPALYKTGYVFHTHSGYLRVFVATGFLGLALMLTFIILVLRRIILHIVDSTRLTPAFLFSLLTVIVGASSALFDNEVFFNMNPTSFLFWVVLCLLIRSMNTHAQAVETSFDEQQISE